MVAWARNDILSIVCAAWPVLAPNLHKRLVPSFTFNVEALWNAPLANEHASRVLRLQTVAVTVGPVGVGIALGVEYIYGHEVPYNQSHQHQLHSHSLHSFNTLLLELNSSF